MNSLVIMNEEEVVDQIERWFDLIEQKMSTEAAHQELREGICDKVRSGAIPALQVIAEARAGDEDCHAVLVTVVTEMFRRHEWPPH